MTALNFPVRLGPAEQALIAQLRSVGAAEAAERLETAGLPTRRVESYHYTDLKMLLGAVPPLVSTGAEGAPALDLAGAYRLSIGNGQIAGHAAAPAGVVVGKAEGSAITVRDDVIVRLNSALARESLTLAVEGEVAELIVIDHTISGVAGHVSDSARIFVADGATVTIVETYSGSDEAHLGNHSTFVSVGKGAKLTHVTIDLSGQAATHFATVEYELAEEANLRSLIVHAGSNLSRSQIFGRFNGEGAHADFTGLNLVADGKHCDFTLDVTHGVPNTTSQELFKQIARGRSKAVFQGRILVARDAQKTDGKMMMQGLMLSDEAEILSKPELEIYADDVVCGHGSTCGALDEDSMFYLQSRGIPKEEAETMLVRGFLEELIDPIEDETLGTALSGIVDGWLLNGK